MGVDIFFVISGFVITTVLLREIDRTGRLSLLRFYQRRFQRLTPALAVVVSATLLASALLLAPFGQQQIAAKTGVGAITLVANLVIAKGTGGYFDPAAASNPLLHTWSLSVEEQFYLVFPTLFILAVRLGRRALMILLALACAASLAAAAALSTTWPFGFYSPMTRAWEFGLGVVIVLWAPTLRRRTSDILGLAGFCALIASVFLMPGGGRWPGMATLVPTVGAALCIVAGLPRKEKRASPATSWLSSRPLVTVGDYSYSLYLWHWPFISLATMWSTARWVAPAAAALSVIPAVLSFRLVEEPIRRANLRRRREWTVAVGSSLLLPLAAAGVLTTGVQTGWHNSALANLASRSGTHLGWNDCLRLDTDGNGTRQIDTAHCTFGSAPASRPKLYLVGDSNAAMYSDPASSAAQALKRELIIRTAAGCSLADLYRGNSSGVQTAGDKACRSYVDKTLDELSHAPKGSVVFIAEAPSQWTLPGRSLSLSDRNFRSDFPSRVTTMSTGLSRTVQSLKAKGMKPVLIEPVVTFPDDAPSTALVACRTTLSILMGTCPRATPLASASDENSRLRASVRELATREAVPFVEIARRQCPGGMCPPTIAGAPVEMDAGHFSAAFAKQLSPDFTAAARP